MNLLSISIFNELQIWSLGHILCQCSFISNIIFNFFRPTNWFILQADHHYYPIYFNISYREATNPRPSFSFLIIWDALSLAKWSWGLHINLNASLADVFCFLASHFLPEIAFPHYFLCKKKKKSSKQVMSLCGHKQYITLLCHFYPRLMLVTTNIIFFQYTFYILSFNHKYFCAIFFKSYGNTSVPFGLVTLWNMQIYPGHETGVYTKLLICSMYNQNWVSISVIVH